MQVVHHRRLAATIGTGDGHQRRVAGKCLEIEPKGVAAEAAPDAFTELFPQLLEEGIEEDDTPSCSVRMSLASQGLFVNDIVVRWAGQLLYELFSTGLLQQHGVVVNLAAKRCGPIEVDPAVWKRFGVRRRRPTGQGVN